MRQERFSGAYDGYVHFIDSPVFMYSPAPVIVEMPDAPDGYRYKLTLTNSETGESYSETRQIHNGKAHFEISQILQHLMSVDISEVFSATRHGLGAYDSFNMAITEIEDDTTYEFFFWAIYGALDQMESFSHEGFDWQAKPRRLWVNYPQTFRLQCSLRDTFYFSLPDGTKIYPEGVNSDYLLYEVDLMKALDVPDNSALDVMRGFYSGRTQTIGLSSLMTVSSEGRRVSSSSDYYIRLIPDLAQYGQGTYLRWLQRDGSFGYWLFENGDQAVAAAEGSAFQRTLLGNPNEFVEGQPYDTPARADFTETQTLTLGTYVNNQDEYDYLMGLITSPVVDRLINKYGDKWQRVNIAPGSYARSCKRTTPHRSSIEIAITLPQRNTIKL